MMTHHYNDDRNYQLASWSNEFRRPPLNGSAGGSSPVRGTSVFSGSSRLHCRRFSWQPIQSDSRDLYHRCSAGTLPCQSHPPNRCEFALPLRQRHLKSRLDGPVLLSGGVIAALRDAAVPHCWPSGWTVMPLILGYSIGLTRPVDSVPRKSTNQPTNHVPDICLVTKTQNVF